MPGRQTVDTSRPFATQAEADDAMDAAEASAAAMQESRAVLADVMGDGPPDPLPDSTSLAVIDYPPVGGPPLVYAALARVMADMPGISKTDRAPEAMGGYQFRGIERITREVQQLFARHGVIVWPSARVIGADESVGMKKGWFDWRVEVTWTVAGVDGIALDPPPVTIGIGRDGTDKGINKAMTQAFKYLLLQLLCVSDGKDDPDTANYTDGQAPEQSEVVHVNADGVPWASREVRTDLSAQIKALSEDQRAQVLAMWTAEDPMTGEPYLPVNPDTGKPRVSHLTVNDVPGVQALINRAKSGGAVLPPALPPKDTTDGPGDGPEAPQDAADDQAGTGTADDPETAIEGDRDDQSPEWPKGEEPF